MVECVFILGNHIQALGIARQVKVFGLPVYLFTESRFSVAKYSNCVARTFFYKDHRQLIDLICEKQNKLNLKPFIIPTNDELLYLLRNKHDELKSAFFIGTPSSFAIDLFYNKRNTYQFAEKNNIPAPKSWYPDNLEDVEKISKQIVYPVIIKPAVMHHFHKKLKKKAFKCNNQDELISTARSLHHIFPINQMLVQEFLEGGPQNLFSFGTFAVHGKPVVSLMANRIRQNPMTFGNSTTFAVTCNIQVIKEQAEKILHLTNYTGLAEVEFMYDEKTNQYKFLEINPRPWKWHTLSHAYGFGFVSEWINWLNNKPAFNPVFPDNSFAWVERFTDFVVILKEILKRKPILRHALSSYKTNKKIYAVWSWKDPLPAIMYILMVPILFFKRH